MNYERASCGWALTGFVLGSWLQTTADLIKARDNAEVLFAEVNHRVANSLAMVSSLVSLQSRAMKDKAAQEALKETEARIHKRLYSSGDARFVDFNEYLSSLLDNVERAMKGEGHGASLRRTQA